MKTTATLIVEVTMREVASKFATSSWWPHKIDFFTGKDDLDTRVVIHYTGKGVDNHEGMGG